MEKNIIPRAFLIFLVVSVLFFCFLIFRPFLIEIIAAAILASIFYTPYQWLAGKLGGRKNLAALVMCILVAVLVIVPLSNFIVYAAQRSIDAYSDLSAMASANDIGGLIAKGGLWEKIDYIGIDREAFKIFIFDLAKNFKDWLVAGGANLIKGTTNFIISLVLIIFTMFFFFVDGERMLEKLMLWTPLPNKYDREIFKKFRDVSYSTIMSTFVTAIAQGIAGAVGFMIVGVPAFFAGVAMAFLSLLPYVGAAFVWVPVAVYLLATGNIWQGIFLLAWGAGIVSTIDNFLRAYLIKGKAQVHPIFIIFSVLGGIALFGFWGIVFGPLIISLAVTILHIYEMEYENILEK